MYETFNVGSTTTKSESESSKAEDDKVGNNSERCICEAKFMIYRKEKGKSTMQLKALYRTHAASSKKVSCRKGSHSHTLASGNGSFGGK